MFPSNLLSTLASISSRTDLHTQCTDNTTYYKVNRYSTWNLKKDHILHASLSPLLFWQSWTSPGSEVVSSNASSSWSPVFNVPRLYTSSTNGPMLGFSRVLSWILPGGFWFPCKNRLEFSTAECNSLEQGCTNPGCLVEYCTVTAKIWESSVWNLVCVTLPVPKYRRGP
jgi:hypothetical protein